MVSLPRKNESVAEQVSSIKEKNDDRQGKVSAVHARVQTFLPPPSFVSVTILFRRRRFASH